MLEGLGGADPEPDQGVDPNFGRQRKTQDLVKVDLFWKCRSGGTRVKGMTRLGRQGGRRSGDEGRPL